MTIQNSFSAGSVWTIPYERLIAWHNVLKCASECAADSFLVFALLFLSIIKRSWTRKRRLLCVPTAPFGLVIYTWGRVQRVRHQPNKRPQRLCPSVFVSACLCVCQPCLLVGLFVCVYECVCAYLCLSVSMRFYLSLSLRLWVCMSISVYLYVWVSASVWVCLSVCACVCKTACASLCI